MVVASTLVALLLAGCTTPPTDDVKGSEGSGSGEGGESGEGNEQSGMESDEPQKPSMTVEINPDTLTDQVEVVVNLTVPERYPYHANSSGGPQFYAYAVNESGKLAQLYEYGSSLGESSQQASESEEELRKGNWTYRFNWNGYLEKQWEHNEDDKFVWAPHGGDRVPPGDYWIHIEHKDIDFLQEDEPLTVEPLPDS